MMSYDNFMICLTTCLTTMFVNRAPVLCGVIPRGRLASSTQIWHQGDLFWWSRALVKQNTLTGKNSHLTMGQPAYMYVCYCPGERGPWKRSVESLLRCVVLCRRRLYSVGHVLNGTSSGRGPAMMRRTGRWRVPILTVSSNHVFICSGLAAILSANLFV